MRSKMWRCPGDGYLRLTPVPTQAPLCPICRGHLIEGLPATAGEFVPMISDDQDQFCDRIMRERPVH